MQEKNELADIVIVGGGPIGYAQALGFKKLNPNLEIVVLEKYPEFARKHTLVMQAKQLEKFMDATETTKEPQLVELHKQLMEKPHIRTNKLQETFKGLAEKSGVRTIIETVEGATIKEQLLKHKPKLIIGADGTHSVVNQNLFPQENQIKHEVDFAMQVRYEIDGDADHNWEDTVQFYQTLARQGLIATEQIGRRDEKTGKTPVTIQLIIPKEDFLSLHNAGVDAKHPIKPFLNEDKKADLVPKHLINFIISYFAEKIKITDADPIPLDSISISVNELPATRARETITEYQGVNVCLNGDAALGLSYFKGLNAGLEASAMFFNKLKPAIQQGLTDKNQLQTQLATYQDWFLPYADKKVEEVKDYSASKIRSALKIVKVVHALKGFSHSDVLGDQKPLIQTFYRLHAQVADDERIVFDPYPHRSYDPNIHLGQFAYIPITYTLKKIVKLFIDYFKPYKANYQLKEDFKQPLIGLVNIGSGLLKLVVGLFTFNIFRFADGLFSVLRGAIEVATSPLILLKFGTRSFISLFSAPKIEENHGMQKLVALGEELLKNQEDDDFSLVKMQKLLGICNDLHRKFDKALQRKQATNVNTEQEQSNINTLTNEDEPLTRQKFSDYFTLFRNTKTEPLGVEEDTLRLSLNTISR